FPCHFLASRCSPLIGCLSMSRAAARRSQEVETTVSQDSLLAERLTRDATASIARSGKPSRWVPLGVSRRAFPARGSDEGEHRQRQCRHATLQRLADNGLKAWAQVIERGYEALVAKDPASPYRGGRTLAWLKVKVANFREGERGWEA